MSDQKAKLFAQTVISGYNRMKTWEIKNIYLTIIDGIQRKFMELKTLP